MRWYSATVGIPTFSRRSRIGVYTGSILFEFCATSCCFQHNHTTPGFLEIKPLYEKIRNIIIINDTISFCVHTPLFPLPRSSSILGIQFQLGKGNSCSSTIQLLPHATLQCEHLPRSYSNSCHTLRYNHVVWRSN